VGGNHITSGRGERKLSTGVQFTASLVRELQRCNARYGMVTMCMGGGMGAAGIFERP